MFSDDMAPAEREDLQDEVTRLKQENEGLKKSNKRLQTRLDNTGSLPEARYAALNEKSDLNTIKSQSYSNEL